MEEIKTEEVAAEAPETKKEKKSKKDAERAELLEKIDTLTASLAEKDDKYLRMAAEYDNFRRRSREEKDATYEVAMADTVSDFLAIIDNLERAAFYDDAEKVKSDCQQADYESQHEDAKSQERLFAENPYCPLQQHFACEETDDEAQDQEEVVFFPNEQREKSVAASAAAEGIEYQENGRQPADGDEITGALQVSAAIGMQR